MRLKVMRRKAYWACLLATSSLAVCPAQADLVHRYSFTADATDSVGGANGTLAGGATVGGGEAQFNGSFAYVDLPIGSTIGGLHSSSFEAWVTWNDTAQWWSRVFDFGTGMDNYMFLTPKNGRIDFGASMETPRFTMTIPSTMTPLAPEPDSATASSALPSGEVFMAVTIDESSRLWKLYINGTLAGTSVGLAFLTPSDLGVTTQNWLGRSQYPDPYFNGTIDEFRIYSTALTQSQIAAQYLAGPDSLYLPVPEALPSWVAALTLLPLCAFGRRKLAAG